MPVDQCAPSPWGLSAHSQVDGLDYSLHASAPRAAHAISVRPAGPLVDGRSEVAVLDQARAQRRRAISRKARRILREAVELRSNDAAKAKLDRSESSGDLVSVVTLSKVALDTRKAADALATSDFFADLGQRQLAMLAMGGGIKRKHCRYAAVYREGAASSCFFVLVKGRLEERSASTGLGADVGVPAVWGPRILGEPKAKREKRVLAASGRPGSCYVLFGMEALLGRTRTSSVSALEDSEVLTFVASDLHLHLRKDGVAHVARKVFDCFVEAELRHTTPFRDMPARQLKQLVSLLSLEDLAAGTELYQIGSPADKLYILTHGRVDIVKGAHVLAKLEATQGQAANLPPFGLPIFGEMAVLDRKPRVNAAVVTADAKLLVLPVEQFAACTLAVPDFKARLRKLRELRRKSGLTQQH